MKSKLILAAAMLAFAAPAAKAQVVVDMSLITCGQYMKAPEARKALISSWMSGYYMSSKNLLNVDMRYVKRNHEVIDKYCKRHPKETLMQAIAKNAK
ncbi:HdeA family protein [Rhodoblastus acidophilus]|uniref:HdeA family protein n=1 Tax=Candidatus Rhodoblastus alkanivorans TaxID=2954117 RepID=A0ABS9Z4L6_9HYPH|nr:HdeA/HdeB family chaperone [Candidatus Rhodoblastus alkanivorans]MCI4679260.1 HdeA family protein [Candidatus Rhodoblastus alkanivorans]MCI4682416.1 HdeA family protein [Candidatus Rhodoblastus alkanivorans]MDI4639721.1 HdeA family protein [Rhodoblastus acidophilus]